MDKNFLNELLEDFTVIMIGTDIREQGRKDFDFSKMSSENYYEKFMEALVKNRHNSKEDERLAMMYLALEEKLGDDFKLLFDVVQKLAFIRYSKDLRFILPDKEELDVFEMDLKTQHATDFEKIKKIWKKFKKGKMGIFRFANEVHEAVGMKFLALLSPLLNKTEVGADFWKNFSKSLKK